MSTSKKVKEVFAVLTSSIPGHLLSQGQLLEDAYALVDLFDESANDPVFELRLGGRPISEWDTDRAMNNQAWRLVSEERCVKEAFELDDEAYQDSFQKAKFLMEYEV